jgi:putative hydrolase of the HAD superfamily
MKKYKGILFDLDHTLWDYEANAIETLEALFFQHLRHHPVAFADFQRHFFCINTRLWADYDQGLISRDVIREQRFQRVLQEVGVDDYELSLRFSDDYVRESPTKKRLLPHALDVLNYLSARYPMAIVTNGFEDIQQVKINSAGLRPYFAAIVTSETAACKKPEPGIFELALARIGCRANEVLMVGDNLLTDMAGARQAGIDQVCYNPAGASHNTAPTYEIRRLDELKSFL